MGARYIIFFPFSSFCECVCVCFCVRLCLYSFAYTICPMVLSVGFFFVFLFFCFYFKNCFFFLFFLIVIFLFFYFNNFILFYLTLFYFILFLFFFLFFLPFILSRADERLLVLQPGIRAVPLRWERQLQDTGTQETSHLHVIPNDDNLPEISISTPRPRFTQRPASYSAGHPMPNN